MDGSRFNANMASWPPPRTLYGPDINGAMFGTYVLCDWTPAEPFMARYAARIDADYQRIRRAAVTANLLRFASEGIGR